jgi:hypothetical protein
MDELDDPDEDDQPRVAYLDAEREGRLARYALPNARDRGAVWGGDVPGAGLNPHP